MATILIVEDDLFLREIAELVIADLGHRTILASDTIEAINHLNDHQQVDALFTDIRLKGEDMGGITVANFSVIKRPELRVLYSTGNMIEPKMRSQFVAGALFLQKPYSFGHLQSAIITLLGDGGTDPIDVALAKPASEGL